MLLILYVCVMPLVATFRLLEIRRVFLFFLLVVNTQNLLAVLSVNCRTDNTQLYLNVFQKCSEFCGGNLQRESTTTFRVVCRTEDAKLYSNVYQKYRQGCKGVSRRGPNTISKVTPSAADVMRMDCESRKLMPTDAADVFQAYFALCSRGIGGRRSVNVRQTTTVSSSNFIHNNGIRNTGPSTSLGGRNARGNSKVNLTIGEATCSRGIGGHPSLNVRLTITISNSNFIDDNDARKTGPSTSRGGRNTCVNPGVSLTTAEATCSSGISRRHLVRRRPSTRGPTVGSSSAIGAWTSYTYTDFGDSDMRCHHCGASFWTTRDKCKELDIAEFKIRLYNGQGARGYEFPTSNTLGAMVFESGITSNTDFDGKKSHNAGLLQILASFSLAAVRPDFQGKETISTIRRCALHIRVSEAGIATLPHFALAELPDPRIDPNGHNIIFEMMMHGPCGAANMKASCMKGDKCGKSFPKKFNSKTFFDDNGHVHYQRRDTSITTTRNQFKLDNSYVVPYNRDLLLAFHYVEGRFICAHEAYWRIFKFDIHHREPVVQILAVHLEDIQRITFRDRVSNEMGRNLSYLEFPSKFAWHSDSKSWSPRRNSKSSIGQIILNNYGKSLQSFGLPPPPTDLLEQLANRLLMEERNYNREELTQLKNDSVPRLNADQKAIYDLIMNADENSRQELIFVYGHGGTSKTFLWKMIISSFCSQGKIVLAVTSSSITSLLLPSGRTTHSRFKLPLELTEESLRRITKNTHLRKLLADTDLIIWDEAPMNDRRCFEALNRSLRYIVNKPFSLFGVYLVNSFASWLLDIGDRKIGRPAEEDLENTSWIDIPASYCLTPDE
ncbi:DNA helicase [Tanacetum coccineum]